MEITLPELLKGKATVIKDNEYFKTEAYVTPFLERMSKFTDDFRIQVKMPDQITKTKDGGIDMEDITYNRVWIQAVMPEEYLFDNHDEVVGFIYGLDVRKPIVKIYRGGLNRACTNLCVFNPSFLSIQELSPEKAINYRPVTTLMEQTNDMKVWLEKLHNTEFARTDEQIERNLGMWVRNSINMAYDSGYGKVKLAASTPIDAYKLLFDKKSEYFIPEDQPVNMFTVYNAFTQLISNDGGKDIMNKVEKTLLLKDILTV